MGRNWPVRRVGGAEKRQTPAQCACIIARENPNQVSLYFEARFCCVSGAKVGVCCSHPTKVLSVSATKFRAMCSDKSEWDVDTGHKALMPCVNLMA